MSAPFFARGASKLHKTATRHAEYFVQFAILHFRSVCAIISSVKGRLVRQPFGGVMTMAKAKRR
jgi:hypothetical protein